MASTDPFSPDWDTERTRLIDEHPADGTTRQVVLEYEVDTDLSDAWPVDGLFCNNSCGYINHRHVFKERISKETSVEASAKNASKISGSVGIKLGDKKIGLDAKVAQEIAKSLETKFEAKVSVEKEVEIVLGQGPNGIQCAANCRKIFAAVGVITRIDLTGKVFWYRTYTITLSSSAGGKAAEPVLSWGAATVDLTHLVITPSAYVGLYSESNRPNLSAQCKDNCRGDLFIEGKKESKESGEPPAHTKEHAGGE